MKWLQLKMYETQIEGFIGKIKINICVVTYIIKIKNKVF